MGDPSLLRLPLGLLLGIRFFNPAALTLRSCLAGRLPPSGRLPRCIALGWRGCRSNRHDLSYLLENIIDPGAVVSPDYRMSIFEMKDGRVMTGVIAAENDNTVTLQQMAEETVVEKSVIKKGQLLKSSMMPEGLLQPFSDEKVRGLIGCLRHPGQVPLR